MMELRDASRIAGGGLRGAIYGENRGRGFKDGDYVITSPVKSIKGNIYTTRNSTYKVEFAK